jgi:Zn-dependent M28 family amino/carboxypeptidase
MPPASLPPSTPAEPDRFDAAAAMRDVRLLAGGIGPRLATGPAYREAGRLVARRFARLGYDVRRESFPVPAGDSWGVPVSAGRSFNVVAEPAGFDGRAPYLLLGAHLDTVAVAPGAEDNASGVAVLLEIARLTAEEETRLPVVLVAFGAEEPRGTGDDMHHFGSVHHVASLPQRHRDSLNAMVSLDRVGVGAVVPVCTGPLSPPVVQEALLRAAERVDVPTTPCENTASDHWSFEKAGYPVARLGSTSYAAYHSEADLPAVVDAEQLARTGQVAWSWLVDR